MLKNFRDLAARLHRDEAGQGLVEYVLVVALLVLVATATMTTVGSQLNTILMGISNVLKNAIASIP